MDSAEFRCLFPLSSHSLLGNKLSDAGVQPIAQALANHPTLKTLQYDLPPHLPLSPPSLITISLWYNWGITDASCTALADLLRTVPTLEKL